MNWLRKSIKVVLGAWLVATQMVPVLWYVGVLNRRHGEGWADRDLGLAEYATMLILTLLPIASAICFTSTKPTPGARWRV